jgi:hypothetical protein
VSVLASPPVFGTGRALLGLAAWVAPDTTSRAFGLEIKAAAGSYWSRLFGVRDVVLGLGLILSDGEDRRRWRMAAIACDAADAVAGELAARESRTTGLMRYGLPAGAAAFAALGVVGLLAEE